MCGYRCFLWWYDPRDDTGRNQKFRCSEFCVRCICTECKGAAAYSICQKPLIESGFKALFLTAFAMTSAFIPMTVLVVYTLTNDSSQYDNFMPKQGQIVALVYCAVGISAIDMPRSRTRIDTWMQQ